MAKHHKDSRNTAKLNGWNHGTNVGKIVKLVGKSRHGKNRVREQGERWEVIGERSEALPSKSSPAPFLLLQTAAPEHHIRWVSLQRDPDFMIEMVDED